MPALGYTFCCHINEAAEFIPEIPKNCLENDDDDYALDSGAHSNEAMSPTVPSINGVSKLPHDGRPSRNTISNEEKIVKTDCECKKSA